jgi:hypothetical protein
MNLQMMSESFDLFYCLSLVNSYIEWEKYPDRCEKANEILTKYKDKFSPIPEFQVQY